MRLFCSHALQRHTVISGSWWSGFVDCGSKLQLAGIVRSAVGGGADGTDSAIERL